MIRVYPALCALLIGVAWSVCAGTSALAQASELRIGVTYDFLQTNMEGRRFRDPYFTTIVITGDTAEMFVERRDGQFRVSTSARRGETVRTALGAELTWSTSRNTHELRQSNESHVTTWQMVVVGRGNRRTCRASVMVQRRDPSKPFVLRGAWGLPVPTREISYENVRCIVATSG
jgi:hypothetical protein